MGQTDGWIALFQNAPHPGRRRGRRYNMLPPTTAVRRWHIVSPPIRPSASVNGSKNRRGCTSVRGRVRARSLHVSGGRQWLSCRQPAYLQPKQLHHGTDRRTDRAIPKCPHNIMPPHNRDGNAVGLKTDTGRVRLLVLPASSFSWAA